MDFAGDTALGPYRVLDLSDETGWLCARMLGDLGADVIKVEPPGGDPGRQVGPFYHEERDPEKSLRWYALNANKRGVTLDLAVAPGQDALKALVATADFIIESFSPGYLDSLGLGYSALSAINPRMIMTSITPFGHTGPRRDWKATDLVSMAMSGLMYLTGDPDRAPVRVQPAQSPMFAGAQAAVGTLLAHHHRQLSGVGQHVDVSVQESLITANAQSIPFWHLRQINLARSGSYRAGLSTTAVGRQTWPCKDGLITFAQQGGTAVNSNKNLTAWIDEEGLADEFLKAMDWETFDMASATQELLHKLEQPMARFFLTHTQQELYQGAHDRNVRITPVYSPANVYKDKQLEARGFWEPIEHSELGQTLTYPGAFARMSRTAVGPRRRAPLIGEHNEEILGEDSAPRAAAAVVRADQQHVLTDALSGLKVLDFSWVIAGPLITKYLADYGATLVRLESTTRMDSARRSAPYRDGVPGVNTGGTFVWVNSNKRSMTVDFMHPEGRKIVEKLVAWADVVVENFSAGTMARLGFDYEELRKINPEIIMLQTAMLGQTGPYAHDRGNGILLTSLTGLTHSTGWPDRDPTPPFGAYTDYVVPMFGASALLSALDYRRRTGKGQLIDLSQYEAALQFIGPSLLDSIVNDVDRGRHGNQSEEMAPHAVYRCLGDDRWCSVAVTNDAEWQAFCRVIGRLEWMQDPRFDTLARRKANEDELNQLIETWTSRLRPENVAEQMQAAGVPAGVVQMASDLLTDPHLRDREFFWWLEHRDLGSFPHAGSAFKLSRTPTRAREASPSLGEHTATICREVLDMSDEEFVALFADGVFE